VPNFISTLKRKHLQRIRLEVSDNLVKEGKSFAELLALVFGESGHGSGQGIDAALAAFPHQADAFGGRFEADAPSVFGGVPAHQS
jgi:hypothetical protein